MQWQSPTCMLPRLHLPAEGIAAEPVFPGRAPLHLPVHKGCTAFCMANVWPVT